MAADLSKLPLSSANNALPSLENISLPVSGFLKPLFFTSGMSRVGQKKKIPADQVNVAR